jgi:hypothetical protein
VEPVSLIAGVLGAVGAPGMGDIVSAAAKPDLDSGELVRRCEASRPAAELASAAHERSLDARKHVVRRREHKAHVLPFRSIRRSA